MNKILIPILIVVLGLPALIIFGFVDLSTKIDLGQVMEIVILAVLVTVTAIYAEQTLRIANATKEQAEEMRKQRYNALRPIIDIVEQPTTGMEKEKQGFDAKEGKFPKDLLCILRNIGVGPAIEVFSFIEGAEDKPRRRDFDTIPVAIGAEEMGYAHEERLLLEQRGNHSALVAYYKDVYGNLFESVREVSVDRNKQAVNIGALKIHPLPKKG